MYPTSSDGAPQAITFYHAHLLSLFAKLILLWWTQSYLLHEKELVTLCTELAHFQATGIPLQNGQPFCALLWMWVRS